MTHHFGKALAAAALALAGFSASAASVNYSGNLGDTGNPYLYGSDLAGPVFVDPDDSTDNSRVVANNVAMYQLVLAQGGTLTITSDSLGSGGVDSYVSLFSGSTQAATFIDSRMDDFTWTMSIAAGSYWVTIGDWENMSFAENLGHGTLADGFIGVGDPNWLGDGHYDVTVSLDTGATPPPPIPEPSQAVLLMLGLAAVGTRAWRARRAG